jgi:hypothetical protein
MATQRIPHLQKKMKQMKVKRMKAANWNFSLANTFQSK